MTSNHYGMTSYRVLLIFRMIFRNDIQDDTDTQDVTQDVTQDDIQSSALNYNEDLGPQCGPFFSWSWNHRSTTYYIYLPPFSSFAFAFEERMEIVTP